MRYFDGNTSVMCARLAAAQGWRVHAVYNARNKHQQDEFTCPGCLTKKTNTAQRRMDKGGEYT